MTYKEQINKEKLPQHVAIIMDGNGRWAMQRGMDRTEGHKNAIEAVRDTITGAAEIGIKYLTRRCTRSWRCWSITSRKRLRQ